VNTWQILQQLRFKLLARRWEDAVANQNVFQESSVIISVGGDEAAMATLITPTCVIQPLGASSDPSHDEEPDLIMQSINVRVTVTVPGDPLGEYSLIGGGRQDQGDSRGRGLLEVEEEILGAIGELNTIDGVVIYNRAKSEAQAELDDNDRYTAMRAYSFEALTSASRFYPPAEKFAAVDAGAAGDADLTWIPAPIRFDSRGVRILRVAGAVPTLDPADGGAVVVLDGSAFPAPAGAITDSPGAGQWSWTIWITFDEWNSGTTERFSDPKTSTVTVT